MPWYNKANQKAYIKKEGVVQESVGIVKGPHGIAMAIFVHMPPIEIPNIRNEMLDAQEEGDKEKKKKKEEEEKKKPKVPKKPSAAKEAVQCGPHKLPDGWTTGTRKYKTGAKKDKEYKIWVAPDGTECDRWSKVECYLADLVVFQ